jgi:DNA-binding NarL/FixJ family response regulator
MTASPRNARVLIVEDSFVVADALRYLVDGYGDFVSTIVPTLERAFAALAADLVDIAVLDVNLNGTSVLPFAEHLHATGVPFVFLTGYGDEQVLPEHLRAHLRFDKPVDAEPFVRALRELTAGRRAGPAPHSS